MNWTVLVVIEVPPLVLDTCRAAVPNAAPAGTETLAVIALSEAAVTIPGTFPPAASVITTVGVYARTQASRPGSASPRPIPPR